MKMVQGKEGEGEKVLVNGDVKKEENGEIKTNENASVNEESDDDDYLDYLLMVPPLDNYSDDRNKCLVSRTLLDFCSALESRKEYPKIRQELLMQSNTVPKQENKEPIVEEQKDVKEEIVEDNLVKIEELPPETIIIKETVLVNGNGDCEEEPTSTGEEDDERTIQENGCKRVPGVRRQSVRLKKAQFGESSASSSSHTNSNISFIPST